MNGALQKQFRIAESKTFAIRADAVNILNRPVWGNPTPTSTVRLSAASPLRVEVEPSLSKPESTSRIV
jgi:hypothetical protein